MTGFLVAAVLILVGIFGLSLLSGVRFIPNTRIRIFRLGALASHGQGKRSEEAKQLRSEIRKSLTGKTTDKKE